MEMKICKKCKENKPLSGFPFFWGKYFHSTCKACHYLIVKKYRQEHKEHVKKCQRDYLKKTHYKTVHKSAEKYPEKTIARKLFEKALKQGKIKKLPCKECGNIKSQGHHPDYSKPLEVIWLCKKHHDIIHGRYGSKFL